MKTDKTTEWYAANVTIKPGSVYTVEPHTPGPWTSESRSMSDGSLVVKDSAFNEICCIRPKEQRHYGPQNNTDMANANLIAAAPELLEACKTALRQFESMCASACARKMSVKWTPDDTEALNNLSAAIAKAEGKQ